MAAPTLWLPRTTMTSISPWAGLKHFTLFTDSYLLDSLTSTTRPLRVANYQQSIISAGLIGSSCFNGRLDCDTGHGPVVSSMCRLTASNMICASLLLYGLADGRAGIFESTRSSSALFRALLYFPLRAVHPIIKTGSRRPCQGRVRAHSPALARCSSPLNYRGDLKFR